MNEDFLHYIWKYRLFDSEELMSSQGQYLELIDVGRLNRDSGPDFFEARIQIDDLLWVGNVEIHIKSSDWYKHHHEVDSAYNNVILHVVLKNDTDIILSDGRLLPCLELKIPDQYLKRYQNLMSSQSWIPCQVDIPKLNNFFVNHWLDRMLLERLERKAGEINQIYHQNADSWEETFYQLLARYFGMKVNADPFEQLARSVSLKILAKHKNSLLQLEAILFGQAGFLDDSIPGDPYYCDLQREYRFLKNKFELKPIEKRRWKFMRIHPVNFPIIRIAQFAKLIYQSQSLFSKIKQVENVNEFYLLLETEASQYWDNHYRFGEKVDFKKKVLGRSTIDILIINAIVPILFVYGKEIGNHFYLDRVLVYLEQMKPERNSIVKSWIESGVVVKSAFDSQSLLHLKSEYCNKYKCLECELGNRILRLEQM
ncbi:DUF2851 family protein [Ancylomarina euxinus]|uniref:DUF2851 family protein n=1 Tax=Ancylomarina euxinus TaxID=2283627 RepID=A0A425XYM8_9BACT|nr:DUF2851 family protein [Ancylomarina euxinus]MCZ4695780.1 DUF2851 family protein [Ancylomarina euxinus]MUP16157.1 DUF2851 family protein [Ancylomarina euxinus]RRG19876.1 DUF2851 family protein [Ancylomarina euxinus]